MTSSNVDPSTAPSFNDRNAIANRTHERKHSTESAILEEVIKNELSRQDSNDKTTVKIVGLDLKILTEESILLFEEATRLSLRKNKLSGLPTNFSMLQNLRYLDLNSNRFCEIPPILFECLQLEILDLSSNNIREIPKDIPSLWSKNLKILSLKNNRVSSIYDLRNILKLDNLNVLEIEGNYIPKEELELIETYSPNLTGLASDEYWTIALRRYFEDHPEGSNTNKISKASKRMGFINTANDDSRSSSNSTSASEGEPVSSVTPLKTEGSHNHNASNDLYNHSKYNDYFKRLSILPEEVVPDEKHRISHTELVVACRKLLFSFTECQEAIRKIASFCKDKSVAVNIVSLLYSVRSHIDNLVEILQQAENEENFHDQPLIKLCITIIGSFKQIISFLRKNFKTFFEEDDLCFLRMFYMTLLCSYNEIYNAWSYISSELPPKSNNSGKIIRTQTRKRSESFVVGNEHSHEVNNVISEVPHTNSSSIMHKIRTKSVTLQNSHLLQTASSVSSNNEKSANMRSLGSSVLPGTITSSTANKASNLAGADDVNGDISNISNHSSSSSVIISQMILPTERQGETGKQKSEVIIERTNASPSSVSANSSNNSSRSISVNATNANNNPVSSLNNNTGASPSASSPASSSKVSTNVTTVNTSANASVPIAASVNSSSSVVTSEQDSKSTISSEAQQNIDLQLHQMLSNVVKMVSVVYNQLTSAISKTALASTIGKQVLTDSLASKIRDLTDTCCQAMDLSKILDERLQLLLNNDPLIVEKYLSTVEKLKTWEKINAFLKSIISILGNTKVIMADLPNLNEIRPNLASLAKITKDVTVILDSSSYKSVSVTASQIQKQQHLQQMQLQQQQQVHTHQQQINSHTHVPLLTPQPLSGNINPFEQL
ncbi:hypothetical protein KAFR_0C05110 [Kazachstania africana CBS 2517]|uniref:RAM signaling network component n=1 Tax=Kazachstania africana (strain ATCC 22294 / BCRC 22015 / CBS 2517 / CECT 1963 / NBRC 1671 / NRRL Y-8276) TaxID=1071382 RepID=H2AT02_KAZAF|nr:hypothetical protein KAFR_0C05110 [Kazachstania africana CBS 2517]CCF57502.1 hypothetical protein KAFR_0C05110 [Kazachstania africana CBS 2517]